MGVTHSITELTQMDRKQTLAGPEKAPAGFFSSQTTRQSPFLYIYGTFPFRPCNPPFRLVLMSPILPFPDVISHQAKRAQLLGTGLTVWYEPEWKSLLVWHSSFNPVLHYVFWQTARKCGSWWTNGLFWFFYLILKSDFLIFFPPDFQIQVS